MTRRIAALAVSLFVGDAAACPFPHAVLDGDPTAIAIVTPELVKLGVSVGGALKSSCQVFATVTNGSDASLDIAIKHDNDTVESRTVVDPTVAAAWIDTWLQDDFDGPQFTTKLATANIVSQSHPDLTQAMEPPEPASNRAVGVAVSAAFDQAWNFDGSRWTGISAGVCAKFDALCFGVRGHYAAMSELTGQTAAARSDLSVLATASYDKHVGRMELVPELGVGVGRSSTSRIDGCRRVQTCDPDHDPQCMVPPVEDECISHDPDHAYTLDLEDHLSVSSVTPRAAGAMRIAISIADHLWLDGSASVMVSPFAHTDAYGLPAGTPPPFGIPANQLALPGESVGTFELGIGLRWGTR